MSDRDTGDDGESVDTVDADGVGDEPTEPSDSDVAADSTDALEGTADDPGALERVRTEPRLHAVAVVAAVAVGLLLSWRHWFGLIAGGALVALTAATPWRGVAGALGFGVVVFTVFALTLGGSVGAVLEMTPVIYLVVASAFGLPLLGSLVRGLV